MILEFGLSLAPWLGIGFLIGEHWPENSHFAPARTGANLQARAPIACTIGRETMAGEWMGEEDLNSKILLLRMKN